MSSSKLFSLDEISIYYEHLQDWVYFKGEHLLKVFPLKVPQKAVIQG